MSKEVLFGVSVLIAIFGTISNSLSLSYFIGLIRSTSRVHRRNTGCLTTKLFAALNIFDLIVSVSSTFAVVAFFFFKNVIWLEEAAAFILRTSLYATAFLTCLLAVVRTINLAFPLYVINWTAVKGSILVYNVFIIILQLVRWLTFINAISIAIDINTVFVVLFCFSLLLVAAFLIVVLSNIVSLGKLYFTQSEKTTTWRSTRKATVTVAIISAIYCICNIIFIVSIGITSYTMMIKDYALQKKLVQLMN